MTNAAADTLRSMLKDDITKMRQNIANAKADWSNIDINNLSQIENLEQLANLTMMVGKMAESDIWAHLSMVGIILDALTLKMPNNGN